jgi:succinoglycan biosynthesis transport protein ExoP
MTNPDLRRSDVLTVRDYVAVLQRRKWLIALTALALPIAAVLLTLQQTELHQASAQVLVNRQNLAADIVGAPSADPRVEPQRLIETQAALAATPAVAEAVLKALRIRDRTPRDFLEQSSVDGKVNTDILEFVVTDRDPELAKTFATEYARQFTRYRQELDTAALERALREIQDRIRELETRSDSSPALYADLLSKEQQLRAAEALQTGNVVLVRPADEATRVQPRPRRNGLLALAFGAVLGVVLAFFAEALGESSRRTVQSERDLVAAAQLPLLGSVDSISRKNGIPLVVEAMPESPAANAYRLLATRIGLFDSESSIRSLLVVGTEEGDDSGLLAANLAAVLTENEWQVTLVDANSRNGEITTALGLGDRPGYAELVAADTDLDYAAQLERLQVSRSEDLRVLPRGAASAQAVLEVDRARHLLELLLTRTDVVVIAAPPVERSPSTLVWARIADATVLAARRDRTSHGSVNRAVETLRHARATVLGTVLTDGRTVRFGK